MSSNLNLYQVKLPWVGTNEFEHEAWEECELFQNIDHFNFDKKLSRYSKRFNSIELDLSFQAGSKKSKYTIDNIKAWIQLVSKPFTFNVKLSGHITHITCFDKETLDLLWENWWNITKYFGEYLGCILIEFNDICPWNNEWLDKLEYFNELLEKTKERDGFKEIKIVCEFKHSSFYNEIMYHFLRKHNWCVARIHSVNKLPDTKNIELGCIFTYDYIYDEWIDPIIEGWSPNVRTADFTYYKLYGVDGYRCGIYSPIDDVWNVCLNHLEKVVGLQEETYLYMNNTYFPLTIDYEIKEGYPTITNPPAIADCDSVYNKYPRIINHKVDENLIIEREIVIGKYAMDIEKLKELCEIDRIRRIKELEYRRLNNIIVCKYEEKIEISTNKFQSEIILEMKEKEEAEKKEKEEVEKKYEKKKETDKNTKDKIKEEETDETEESEESSESEIGKDKNVKGEIETDTKENSEENYNYEILEDNIVYFNSKNNKYLCNNYKLKKELIINNKKFLNIDHYLYYCEYNYKTNNEEVKKNLENYCNLLLNCDTISKIECLYKKRIVTKNNMSYINKKNKSLGFLNENIKKYNNILGDINWKNKIEKYMKIALIEKFKDNTLKKLLLETKKKKIINKKDDNNMLGNLLMDIRNNL
jgi:uncharacterized protein YecE (DUF72 family)